MTRNLFLSLSLLTAGVCVAAPLSPEIALQRARETGIPGPGTRSAIEAVPALTLFTDEGQPSLYIFNNQGAKGYLVVSADDAITPVLGVSDNAFNSENMPPALSAWLKEYTSQIEYLRKNPSVAGNDGQTRVTLPDWDPIAPMLTTKWDQGAPYNNLCPKDNGQNSYTGCVATSLAQVMDYFQWPAQGQGTIRYDCETLGKTLSLKMSGITFDWDNMIDSYNNGYTAEQAEAVATLMMACGYAVEMEYSALESGAVSGLVPRALVNYFNYDRNVEYIARRQMEYSDWAKKIYDNLKNIGPVIYDASSTSIGGHAFVCDGYAGNGYFHFNWGWSGTADGYFLLDALNPTSIGIGGGLGGYNFDQDAVFGMQPPVGDNDAEGQNGILLFGSLKGGFTGNNLQFDVIGNAYTGWCYQGISSMRFTLGAKIVPVNNPNAEPIYLRSENQQNQNVNLNASYFLPTEVTGGSLRPYFSLSSLNLENNVEYKVTCAYLPSNGEWDDVLTAVGCFNYFYITKTGSGNTASDFKIQNFDILQLSCSSLSLESDLYNGKALKLKATVNNATDTELTRSLTFVLIQDDGSLAFMGDSFPVTLGPGESYTDEWISSLIAQNGVNVNKATEFYPGLYDFETKSIYYQAPQKVKMLPNPGAPTYTTSITVPGAEMSGKNYLVPNSNNFNVVTTISVTKGIFSYPVSLYILEPINSQQANGILSYPYDLAIIEAGQSLDMTAKISFPGAKINTLYYMGIVLNNSNSVTGGMVPFMVLSNEAGVEELGAASGEMQFFNDPVTGKVIVTGGEGGVASVEVYSVSGMRLGAAMEYVGDYVQVDRSALGKGVVVVTATDKAGNRKSVKLAL